MSTTTQFFQRVTLIQCTDSKRDEAAIAADLYDESAYFRDMKEWAISRGNPWFILSAKYGLVGTLDEIEPYDERGISERQAWIITGQLLEKGVEHVDITGGKGYTEHLVPALESQGIDVVNHFEGKQIGDRRHLLQANTPP